MAIGDRVREGRASRRVRKVDPKIDRMDKALELNREVLRRIMNSLSVSETSARAMVSNPAAIQRTVDAVYGAIEADVALALGGGLKTGGNLALDGVQVLEFRFDLLNPAAVEWAEARSGALIVEMATGQVATIQGIVAEGTRAGQGALEIARNIKPTIGLNSRYANAVVKFRERETLRLIKQHPKTPFATLQARANKKADAYAARLLKARAKAIARTELMASANEGQRQAWQQASDAGELNLDDAQREYIATLHGHPLCDDQDGDLIDFDDEFPEGNPPIHTNCGCTEGLRGASIT